ncbi:hypothetical protein CBOM_07339 [Ceraceosorus bombacis]|uniref:DNA replication factor Cdt1 C-terminal domain-containing protein n=1 Tax=Ceraceosorus bombacis TaxID=401625 RepID=A0A0P1B860_9BASI|nr:hypothetical protein CBOM_07339 [Ceraceosorus bombacis]
MPSQRSGNASRGAMSGGPLTSAFLPSSKPASTRSGSSKAHIKGPNGAIAASNAGTLSAGPSRPSTPPPSRPITTHSSPRADLLGAPSPSPRSRRSHTARTQTRSGSPSPSSKQPLVGLGVRTDPDQPGKMWLLLSPSKAAQKRREEEKRMDEGMELRSRAKLERSEGRAGFASPEPVMARSRKRRKMVDLHGSRPLDDPPTSPTIGEMLMRNNTELALPGAPQHDVHPASASSPALNPRVAHALSPGPSPCPGDQTAGKKLKPSAMLDDECLNGDDREAQEEELLTTKDVRESAMGRSLTSYATLNGPAVFRTPSSAPRLSLTSNAVSRDRLSTSNDAIQASSTKSLDFSSGPFPFDLSPDLPLPQHYATLLALHSALEHALVAHLAVKGPGGSSDDATFAPLSPQPNFGRSKLSREATSAAGDRRDAETSKMIRLPGLLTYGALRPVVERASGRDFTPRQLALLAAIWSMEEDDEASSSNKSGDSSEEAQHKPAGIGLLLSRTRTLDARGRKCWDWAIGIEMMLCRTKERDATPPLSLRTPFVSSSAPSTPPQRSRDDLTGHSPASTLDRSPKRPSKSQQLSPSKAREGMSIIALWNMGLEARKKAFKQRLLGFVARAHMRWLEGVRDEKVKGEELDEGVLRAWHDDFPLEHTPLPTPATLPELKAAIGSSVAPGMDMLRSGMAGASAHSRAAPQKSTPSLIRNGASSLVPGPVPFDGSSAGGTSGAASTKKMSLEERIRAKEEAKRGRLQDIAQRSRWFDSRRMGGKVEDVPSTPSSRGGGSVFASPGRSEVADLEETDASAGGAPVVEEQELGTSTKRKEASLRALAPSTSAEWMARFARRSTLSRLVSIAEGLWLLFLAGSNSTSSGGGGSLTSATLSTSSRSAALPMEQVLESVRKSCPNCLSSKEAKEALHLIQQIVPGFLSCLNSGQRQWVRLDRKRGLEDVRRAVRLELES